MDEIHYQSDGANNFQLFLLFMAVFIDLVGFGIIIPILPLLNERLGGTPLDYGLIIAVYSLMQFIFSPIWGNVSDKIGRKPIIIIGLGGSAVGFGIFAYASALWILYFARAVAGIFTAATLTTANAYIADVTPPAKRAGAFSLISAAFGLGFALGPGIGGLMAGVTLFDDILILLVPSVGSHVLPSFVAAGIALFSMFASALFLPESLREKIATKVEGRSKIPILDTLKYRKNENSLLYIGIFSFIAFGLSSFITAFPQFALAIDDNVGEIELGWYFTFVGILLFGTQTFFIRPLISKYGESILVKAGLAMMITGFVSMIFVPTFLLTFLPNAIFTIGIAFLLPTMNSLISNSAAAEDQGNIMGISQGWSAFMRILGPIAGGYFFGLGIRIPFIIGAIVYSIILLVTVLRVNESPGKVYSRI